MVARGEIPEAEPGEPGDTEDFVTLAKFLAEKDLEQLLVLLAGSCLPRYRQEVVGSVL